jgi:hypothetical protein
MRIPHLPEQNISATQDTSLISCQRHEGIPEAAQPDLARVEKALKGARVPKCPAKFAPMSLPPNFRQTKVHKAA